jgi:hypothetical protein
LIISSVVVILAQAEIQSLNDLRVAGSTEFETSSHCVRMFYCLDSRLRGNDSIKGKSVF